MIRLFAFDLDGTLTQHKTHLSPENRAALDALRAHGYQLLMVGAGQCRRIFEQMEHYPIDIIGNYGLQEARYNPETKEIDLVRDEVFPCDKESVDRRITELREKYGFTTFAGKNTEFHPSGCVTFPILGTEAKQEDKLAFDPDRKKRRAIYDDVCRVFSDYTVFVGGSSSFDMAPSPFNKAYALDLYCKAHGIRHEEVVFVGDDYGPGGNDESVYRSDFGFLTVDDYRTFPERIRPYLD